VRYKREEAFRFQFQKPISGFFKIVKENGKNVDSHTTFIDIMNISPNGLMFKSSIDLSIHDKLFLLEISFDIENRTLYILGEPVWKKQEGTNYYYGFIGMDNDETKQEIIEALKNHSKKIYLETKKE